MPPNYAGFRPPAVGGSYRDELSGLDVFRLSDARAKGVPAIATEYSSVTNTSGDRALLVHHDHFALYGSGFIRDLPLPADSEPRWNRNNPAEVYFCRGNELRQFNVVTGADSLIRKFQEYQRISGAGEGDLQDGDHFAFCGGAVNADEQFIPADLFVYQISANRKFATIPRTGWFGYGVIDSLYITPGNNLLVSWKDAGSAIHLYDRDGRHLRQIVTRNGHKDVTRDQTGDEVMIWTNSDDPAPICENGIVKVRLADGKQTCLLPLGWNPAGHHLAVHICCPSKQSPWAYVDTYAPSNPQAAVPEWMEFTNEILRVRVDGSGFERLCWHRSRPLNDYTWQPRVTVSADDSRVMWTSNMGAGPEDVYMLRLGAAPPPPVDPPPAPTPVPPAPTPPAPAPTPTPQILTGAALAAAMAAAAPRDGDGKVREYLTADEWSYVYRQVSNDTRPLPDPAVYMVRRNAKILLANWLQKVRKYLR